MIGKIAKRRDFPVQRDLENVSACGGGFVESSTLVGRSTRDNSVGVYSQRDVNHFWI